VLGVDAERGGRLLEWLRLSPGRAGRLFRNLEANRPLAVDLGNRGADQAEEMTLDPLACEIVRDGEDELLVRDRGGSNLRKPGGEGVLVERLSEPTRNLVPDPIRSQLDWPLHPGATLLVRPKRTPSIATSVLRLNGLSRPCQRRQKKPICRDFGNDPHTFPHLWICV